MKPIPFKQIGFFLLLGIAIIMLTPILLPLMVPLFLGWCVWGIWTSYKENK